MLYPKSAMYSKLVNPYPKKVSFSSAPPSVKTYNPNQYMDDMRSQASKVKATMGANMASVSKPSVATSKPAMASVSKPTSVAEPKTQEGGLFSAGTETGLASRALIAGLGGLGGGLLLGSLM